MEANIPEVQERLNREATWVLATLPHVERKELISVVSSFVLRSGGVSRPPRVMRHCGEDITGPLEVVGILSAIWEGGRTSCSSGTSRPRIFFLRRFGSRSSRYSKSEPRDSGRGGRVEVSYGGKGRA